MKPSFALTLIICAYLAPVLFWPHAVNTAVGAEPDTPPAAAQTGGRKGSATPQSAVRGAGNPRKRRRGAATGGSRRSHPIRRGLGQGTRLCRDGTAARRDRDAGRPARRTQELLQWNRERIKTGRAPALLPARLCREAALAAWCPLLPATFGVLGRAAAGSTAMSTARSTAMSSAPAAENTPPTEPGNH